MAIDLRSQIFQLRQDGVSQRGIAKELGISPSKVQRELGKRAPEVRADRAELGGDGGSGNGFHAGVDLGFAPLPAGTDPLLAEERQQLEREQLALRRSQLRGQRLEADRRAAILENPDANGGNFATLVVQMIDRMRDDNRAMLSQVAARQAAPVAPPPASLTDQLSQWRQIGETMQSFAPPKPPSSASDLEFVVAKERLLQEGQDLAARREAELGERRERMQSELRRNEAVASAIEQFGPVLAKAVELWFEERKTPPPAPVVQLLPAGEHNGDQVAAPRPTVVSNSDEVEGECPHCQTALAIAGGQDEVCPRCKSPLVVLAGRIRVRLSGGQLYPPLQAN